MAFDTTINQNSWISHIEQYRSSGLTAKEWCNKNNLSINTLKYWISKLNKQNSIVEDNTIPVFTAITSDISFQKQQGQSLLIRCSNLSIELSEGCNLNLLSSLLDLLKNYD